MEHGFCITDDLLVENLKAESICAHHIVYDYIKSFGKDIYELTIDNALILSCKTAQSKYTNANNLSKELKWPEKVINSE